MTNKLIGIISNDSKQLDGSISSTVDLTAKVAFSGKDGISLEYAWDGTMLGIKRSDEDNFRFVDLKGRDVEDVLTYELIVRKLGFEPISVDKLLEHIREDLHITEVERGKLKGIESGANKYIHPPFHSPDIIQETDDKSFVSLSNIKYWDEKVNKDELPTKVSQLENDSEYLDKVDWFKIDNKPYTFPPSRHYHNDLYYDKEEVSKLLEEQAGRIPTKLSELERDIELGKDYDGAINEIMETKANREEVPEYISDLFIDIDLTQELRQELQVEKEKIIQELNSKVDEAYHVGNKPPQSSKIFWVDTNIK